MTISIFETKEISFHFKRKEVPDDWYVFNAFRPLCGTLENGKERTWTDYGVGPEGIHFAAVDPENSDGYTEMWLKENMRNGAVRIVYGKGNGEVNEEQLAYFGL